MNIKLIQKFTKEVQYTNTEKQVEEESYYEDELRFEIDTYIERYMKENNLTDELNLDETINLCANFIKDCVRSEDFLNTYTKDTSLETLLREYLAKYGRETFDTYAVAGVLLSWIEDYIEKSWVA